MSEQLTKKEKKEIMNKCNKPKKANCLNTNCWVQDVRDELIDENFMLEIENGILKRRVTDLERTIIVNLLDKKEIEKYTQQYIAVQFNNKKAKIVGNNKNIVPLIDFIDRNDFKFVAIIFVEKSYLK